MREKIAVFVFQSSPMLGRRIVSGNLFGSFKQDAYVKQLQADLNKDNINWCIVIDKSEANIEEIQIIADAIICAPGLQKQFYFANFDKSKIFYLDIFEYKNLETKKIINELLTIN